MNPAKPSTMKDLGEFAFIEKIVKLTEANAGSFIGDDAAVLPSTESFDILVTTDVLIEGIHFDLDFISPAALGKKAIAVNLSDIAAMGGKPEYALMGLGMRGKTSPQFALEIVKGAAGEASEFGVQIVGGDTVASKEIHISVTILGKVPKGKAVLRSGANPGDPILVTGQLGDSAMGLKLLASRHRQPALDYPSLVEKHLTPVPRLKEGSIAASSGAMAMIDISDGLLKDLTHLCEMSEVSAGIETDLIPLSNDLIAAARTTGDNPIELALTGGEDYELLFTCRPEKEDAIIEAIESNSSARVSKIGSITMGNEIKLNGKSWNPKESMGYEHFR